MPFSRRKTGENCQKTTIIGYSVYSEQTAIPSILLSGAELMEYYSVHSGIRIGPKRTQLLPISVYSNSGIVCKRTRPYFAICVYYISKLFMVFNQLALKCVLFSREIF